MSKGAKTVRVDVDKQQLECYLDGECVRRYLVSTAKHGVGQEQGSYKTPLGQHSVRAKIGANAPMHAVFIGRRPTGEVWNRELHKKYPGRDWILTRILWLSGLQPGLNRMGTVDTMRRYIYIHGTPDEDNLGSPVSHGCVRMTSEDVVALFDWIEIGTVVTIEHKEHS